LGALAVIWAPVRTLSRAAEERWVLLGFGVTALYAALSIVGGAISFLFLFSEEQGPFGPTAPELPPEFENLFAFSAAFGLVFALVLPFVYWLLVSGLMQLITRFFGGTGPFSGMLAVVGIAQVPFIVSYLVQLPISILQFALLPDDFGTVNSATAENPALGSPVATLVTLLSSAISLAGLMWFVILVVIGAAFARRVGYGESAGSCAISCAGIVGLILVVGVVLAVAVAVIIGAASSAGSS
jgi:hypothetical protein